MTRATASPMARPAKLRVMRETSSFPSTGTAPGADVSAPAPAPAAGARVPGG
jgi:hypothetical protein